MKLRTGDSDKIREHCIEREPFTTHGALWGDRTSHLSTGTFSPGRLPAEHVDSYRASEYAVYSYHTPIAWYGPDGWTFPDEKYSITTSRHQSRSLYFISDWIEK